jgi:hypothetical protein
MTKNKHTFAAEVTALIDRNITDRDERITAVKALTDGYDRADMDGTQLERLTDYILREELTDDDEHKVLHNEYPIMSEHQLARRRDGKHTRKEGGNMHGESPLNHASEVATDGRNYRLPSRRIRSTDDLIFVDENARIRNKKRADQYRKDTSASEIVPYNLHDTSGELTEEFTQRIGIGQRWRDSLSIIY